MTDIRKAAEQALDTLIETHRTAIDDEQRVADADRTLRAYLAEQPQPVAWMLRSVRGDAFHAGSTPPQPVDVFPWVPLYAAPPPPAAAPSEAELPPLPHPTVGLADPSGRWIHYYTAEQMRDYALRARGEAKGEQR